MLQRARVKAGAQAVTFIHHDLAEPLPLASAAFDRVFSCLVLDHIADLGHFFSELHRVCCPNGSVIVSAVHPAMLLRGVQARFVDPVSGRRIGPESYPHQTADYLMAALRTGLKLDHISEHSVDAALAERSPRARKYLGWPLLLLMRFQP
jgi:malonyl-CoA O-methyltransferase